MKNYGRNFFSFSEDNFFDHPFKFTTIKRTNPDILNVFSVIKINKSLRGTSIYSRNCLIESGSKKGFLLSLEKDAGVIIERVRPKTIGGVPFIIVGENTRPFHVEAGLQSKLIDEAPSARFKTKTNPTEKGKWKIVSCHWNGILGDSAVNTSSFWCDGKKDLSILMQGIDTD